MSQSRKYTRGLLIASGLFLLALAWIFFGPADNLADKVKEREITYVAKLGWVNWGHALPHSTKQAYDLFRQKSRLARDSFEFAYLQRASQDIGTTTLSGAYSETWKVASNLTPDEEVGVFFRIFLSVSKGFERHQRDFPMGLSPGSRASSFRPGDLTGDIISLYCTINGSSLDSLKYELERLPLLEPKPSLSNARAIPEWMISYPTDSTSKHDIIEFYHRAKGLSHKAKGKSRRISKKPTLLTNKR